MDYDDDDDDDDDDDYIPHRVMIVHHFRSLIEWFWSNSLGYWGLFYPSERGFCFVLFSCLLPDNHNYHQGHNRKTLALHGYSFASLRLALTVRRRKGEERS